MSIPTDPLKTPSNIPQHQTPPQSQPPAATSTKDVDPTGVWTKFLSMGGQAATPEEVKLFIQGMMKMFNILIQQQNAAAKRASEKLRKASEGED